MASSLGWHRQPAYLITHTNFINSVLLVHIRNCTMLITLNPMHCSLSSLWLCWARANRRSYRVRSQCRLSNRLKLMCRRESRPRQAETNCAMDWTAAGGVTVWPGTRPQMVLMIFWCTRYSSYSTCCSCCASEPSCPIMSLSSACTCYTLEEGSWASRSQQASPAMARLRLHSRSPHSPASTPTNSTNPCTCCPSVSPTLASCSQQSTQAGYRADSRVSRCWS